MEGLTPQVSVLMAYRDRAALLRRTLESWQHWYGATLSGIELVLMDDTSTEPLDTLRAMVEGFSWEHPPRLTRVDREGAHNPGALYNAAADLATAPLFALTNPENLHLGPCLTHARAHWEPNTYLVYGCRSLRPDAEGQAVTTILADAGPWSAPDWYQHSQTVNRQLHFFAVIGRAEWTRVGGFHAAYADGQGYEDDDLVERIHAADIAVRTVDDPAVAHQAHGGRLTLDAQAQNSRVFCEQWGHSPRLGW